MIKQEQQCFLKRGFAVVEGRRNERVHGDNQTSMFVDHEKTRLEQT